MYGMHQISWLHNIIFISVCVRVRACERMRVRASKRANVLFETCMANIQ